MATSNSTNFKLNAQELVESALRLARILGIGQSVESEVMNIGYQNLNIMMRHWENTGVRIWATERAYLFPDFGVPEFDVPSANVRACLESDMRQNTLAANASIGDSSVTLTSTIEYLSGDYIAFSTSSAGLIWYTVDAVVGNVVSLFEVGTTDAASLSADLLQGSIVVGYTTNAWMPLRVIEARRHDLSSNTEVPLRIAGKFDYERIPNKLLQSLPLWLYTQLNIDTTKFYVWPTNQYSNFVIAYSFERRYQDIDASTNDVDFPPEAYEAIRYGLASRMGVEMGIGKEHQIYLDQKAENYFQIMRNKWSGQASVSFGGRR